MFNSVNNSVVNDLAKKVAESTEKSILSQLNDFISRGLIEIRHTGLTFVHSMDSNTVEVRGGVQLVLKDKEYIESLEKRNHELEEMLNLINNTIKGTK